MNYRYENMNNEDSGRDDMRTAPDSADETTSYIAPEGDAGTQASLQPHYEPPENGGADRERQSEDYWREANYNEVSQHEPVFTPGLGSSRFYAPPRRESARHESQEYEAPHGARRGGGFVRTLCLVLVCAVIGAAAGAGGAYYGINNGLIDVQVTQVTLGATPTPEASPVADSAAPDVVIPSGDILSGPDIYGMATQQVVGVSTEIESTGGFNPFYSSGGSSIYGTGFIISEDGYILTNYHVIETAYQYGVSPQIILRDATTYSAKIIGFEATNDVAVLKIDAAGLSPAKIGSSAEVQVGEAIYAVGNPNRLDYTITDGIVSALDREVQVDISSAYSITMFQISAAVNSGNSGGPVYNERGEVIGIVSAKYMSSGTEGLGFAIPIDDAMDIASDLITVGYVTGKAHLGITVQTMSEANAKYYGTRAGAFVFTVTPGSCAEQAGIKPGDIITKLGDTVVTSSDDLKSALGGCKAGEVVSMEIYRDNELMTISVTLGEQKFVSSGSQEVDIPAAG